MGADTKVLVRVLKVHEETLEVYAVTPREAEEEALKIAGVIAVLSSTYADATYGYGYDAAGQAK